MHTTLLENEGKCRRLAGSCAACASRESLRGSERDGSVKQHKASVGKPASGAFSQFFLSLSVQASGFRASIW